MKVMLMMFISAIDNSLFWPVILLLAGVVFLLIIILKSKSYHKLTTQYAVLAGRFADLEKRFAQLKEENTALALAMHTAERQYAVLKAEAAGQEEKLTEKIAYLEEIKEGLSLKFKNISSEIVQAQHESFAAEQKNTLTSLMTPFTEQLQSFKSEVVAAREESIKNKTGLEEQLKNLSELNKTLSQDAENLAEALKGGKKMQGNWGECQLNRILEISGLRKGVDYETQETLKDDEKNTFRPDVIVHLPETRDIIIDSKVSLVDYLAAVKAKDESEQQFYLQKNVASLKAHIDELSAKEYQNLLKNNALNYVIMFIPVESAYIAAIEKDNTLYDYAYRRNVVLATPLSLLPTLRTVENLWRVDNQNRNVQKIAELGGKIYDKLAAFMSDMKKIESGINQAGLAYRNALTKISGRGGALSQAEKMRLLGAKTNKGINLPLNDGDVLLLDEIEPPLENNGESNPTGETNA